MNIKTRKFVLIPRGTKEDLEEFVPPVNNCLVYNTSDKKIYIYNSDGTGRVISGEELYDRYMKYKLTIYHGRYLILLDRVIVSGVVIELSHGNKEANDNFLGSDGELTVDTELKVIRIHDGITPGGRVYK